VRYSKESDREHLERDREKNCAVKYSNPAGDIVDTNSLATTTVENHIAKQHITYFITYTIRTLTILATL
jgi:hypothetical protein